MTTDRPDPLTRCQLCGTTGEPLRLHGFAGGIADGTSTHLHWHETAALCADAGWCQTRAAANLVGATCPTCRPQTCPSRDNQP